MNTDCEKKFSDPKKNHSMGLGIIEGNNTMAFKLNFHQNTRWLEKEGTYII